MARLSISLLGPFQALLDGEPLRSFESNKERALLAYVAAERDHVHARDVVSELLWPDKPTGSALSNLRHTLSCLRKTLDDAHASPPSLLVTRKTIQLNPEADVSVDLASLAELVDAESADPAGRETVELLSKGPFLDGFALDGCPGFEAWIVLTRERASLKMMALLTDLIAEQCRSGAFEAAIEWAERQLTLEPWNEEVHQQLIWLLGRTGKRSAALRQFGQCQTLLDDEFGVEPQPATIALAEAIRNGDELPTVMPGRTMKDRASPPALFYRVAPASVYTSAHRHPRLIARETEIDRLASALAATGDGRGQYLLVAGEAGSGKTALMREFVIRAHSGQPKLAAYIGRCTSFTGTGDPFLPFRHLLSQILGLSAESAWLNGVHREQGAASLQRLLPILVWECPDLVDTLVAGSSLARQAAAIDDEADRWRSQLKRLLDRRVDDFASRNRRAEVLAQFETLVRAAARNGPILLVIDDLQWADAPSIELLFHLCRSLENAPVLICGAYRPAEVALGREWDGVRQRHPLEVVVNELRLKDGDIVIDLDQSNRERGRQFVDAVIDSEPNGLPEQFRAALYQRTEGHPLFTVELIRSLQIAGSLYQDDHGQWRVDEAADWRALSPRIDAMFAERFGRLDDAAREILKIACVEGEVFTLDVIERVQQMDRRTLLHLLGDELWRRHGIVRPESTHVGAMQPAQFRFEHVLFQQYLYDRLSASERALLHGDIGTQLAEVHGADDEEYAGRLAYHFVEAGLVEQAVPCLLRAGRRALRSSALEEAIAIFDRGLSLLERLPESAWRDEFEISLQLAYGNAFAAARGYTDREVGEAFLRAETLLLKSEPSTSPTLALTPVLNGLMTYFRTNGLYKEAQLRGEALLTLASDCADPLMVVTANMSLGITELYLGDFVVARTHLELACNHPSMQQLSIDREEYAHDPWVAGLACLSLVLCALGYTDQAMQRNNQALTLAGKSQHPTTMIYAFEFASELRAWLCRWRSSIEMADETIAAASEYQSLWWQAFGLIDRGWSLLESGQIEAGAEAVEKANRFLESANILIGAPQSLGHLALAYGMRGDLEAGHRCLDKALAQAYTNGEHWWTSELLRNRGRLWTGADSDKAEAAFRQSSAFARKRQAKFFELKATRDLCRLLADQGRGHEARPLLAPLVDWFTEGFDTPDYKEAVELLKACA
jgi:DNA-binding SARP family transcriptional activator